MMILLRGDNLDLLDKANNNILEWTNTHSVNKVILINNDEVLETFHDAYDNRISTRIVQKKDYEKESGIKINNNEVIELLPIGTNIVKTLKRNEFYNISETDNGYIVLTSWETDDFMII